MWFSNCIGNKGLHCFQSRFPSMSSPFQILYHHVKSKPRIYILFHLCICVYFSICFLRIFLIIIQSNFILSLLKVSLAYRKSNFWWCQKDDFVTSSLSLQMDTNSNSNSNDKCRITKNSPDVSACYVNIALVLVWSELCD